MTSVLIASGLLLNGPAHGVAAEDPNNVPASPPPPEASGELAVLTSERQKADAYSSTLQSAWQAHRRGNSPEAMELFQHTLDAPDASDAERVQALYGLATVCTFGLTRDTDASRRYLTQIVEQYGSNPAAPWALLELGRLSPQATAEGRAEARRGYRRVLEDYPDSIAVHEATVRLAASLYSELDPGQVKAASALLEQHLRDHPDNPLASVMHFRLMYWYQEVDRDYDRGLEHSLKLGELKMSDPARWGQHMWNTAQVYRLRKNDPDEALRWYRRIVEEAPNDRMVGDARQMIRLLEARTTPEIVH